MASQLKIEISVDDKGTAVVQQFVDNVKQSMGQVSQSAASSSDSMSFFSNKWVQMTAGVAAAWVTMEKTIQWSEMGAKALQAADSFGIVAESANVSADQLLSSMKRASAGTVDETSIMQKAVKGMVLGFSADQLTDIMETARVSARVTGQDVQTAYETITDALSTQMPRSLRQYGLVTKDQMMIVQQALSAGITDINLYDIVMANAATQSAQFGVETENMAEKVQGFKARLTELKETAGMCLVDFIANLMVVGEDLNDATKTTENFNEQIRLTAEAQKLWNITEATTLAKALTADALARLGAVEAQKLAIESLKATNKAYFDDEESRIKYNAALSQVYQQSTYAIAVESISEREALLDEYYDDQVDMFSKEAAARTDMDRQKVSDATVVAAKIEALDADVAAKKNDLERQKNLATADYYAKQQQLALTHYEWLQDMAVKNAQNYMDVQDQKFAAQTAAIDDIAQYEMLTGKIVEDDEINRLKDMIQEYNDTFVGGWRQGLYQMQASWMTTGKAMTDGVTAFSSNASSTLSTVLFDGWKGQLQGFSTYWTTFTDAMLKKFTDVVAQMAVQWATFQAAEMMGISLPGMGGSGGSTASQAGNMGLTGSGLLGSLSGLFGSSGPNADASLESLTQLADTGDIQAMWDVGELSALGEDPDPTGVSQALLLADSLTGGHGMDFLKSAGSTVVGGVTNAVSSAWDAVSSLFHSGGVVGSDYAPTRMMPSVAFAGAPRLHSGLAPDEFPAILQSGERVLNRAQTAAYDKGSGSAIHIHYHGTVIQEKQAAKDIATLIYPYTKKLEQWGH